MAQFIGRRARDRRTGWRTRSHSGHHQRHPCRLETAQQEQPDGRRAGLHRRSKNADSGDKSEERHEAAAHGEPHAHFGRSDNDTRDGSAPFDPIVDLGTTRARDPDALDPEGFLQVVGHTIYFWSRRPFHGNTLFGVKAAVLIALVSLPAYMKSSAGWCYENRAIWAIFMAQLTLARFRGETAFALFSRILATVIGGVFALVIWYISTGDGRGKRVWSRCGDSGYLSFPDAVQDLLPRSADYADHRVGDDGVDRGV